MKNVPLKVRKKRAPKLNCPVSITLHLPVIPKWLSDKGISYMELFDKSITVALTLTPPGAPNSKKESE